jgi:hypothetical protein
MTFFCIILCRKYDSSQDFETENKDFSYDLKQTRVKGEFCFIKIF